MKEKVLEILANLRPEFDFTADVNFIEEGMLDSFDIVTLVSEIEDNCGVAISGADILPENFASVDAIVDLINKSSNL